jgi:iron complex outermembrane receptor protein
VPTFTERYYRDPAHHARAMLAAERAWGFEGGADWAQGHWLLGVTTFARRESDVIDWVRDTAQEQWQTANIRKVRTHGIEAGLTRTGRAGFMRTEYVWLDSEAPSLTRLSKYAADYARHSFAFSSGLRIPGHISVGIRGDCKQKIDRRSYCGVDLRGGRAFGPFELFAEAANLFDVRYQEITGVDMPPRWIAGGLRVTLSSSP